MAFGYDQQKHVVALVTDPGADNKQIRLFKAETAIEITAVNVVSRDAQGAGSAGNFTLLNYGTSGTAVAGTITSAVGGTAVADRLAAGVPGAATLVDGTLSSGQWVVLDYQETGDWVEGLVTVDITYVNGVGAA